LLKLVHFGLLTRHLILEHFGNFDFEQVLQASDFVYTYLDF
jgi:hypothetical protein